jgi:uncharacterized protein
MKKHQVLTLLLAFVLSSCAPAVPVAQEAPTETAAPQPTMPAVGQQTSTATPDPATLYSLEALASRVYGQGKLTIEYTWQQEKEFTRYYITYDSDGLTIHGFVNIPVGKGPFPVVIALHGYIESGIYKTMDYSTRYADAIAKNGYIVLHPNMRGFPPSDGPTGHAHDYLTGYTVDVLNLLAYVRKEAGQKGSIFANADISRLGIWGHSIGGGIALRVVDLVPEIKAALLYAPVSQRYTNSSAGFDIYDLTKTNAAFSVHQGTADPTVNPSGTQKLCSDLKAAGRVYQCFFYEGAVHTFYAQGKDDPVLIRRTVDFFNGILKTG